MSDRPFPPDGSSIGVADCLGAPPVSHGDIAKRAYEKFTARAGAHGFDGEDWTLARQELLAEVSPV
jgi:hypothetical protein